MTSTAVNTRFGVRLEPGLEVCFPRTCSLYFSSTLLNSFSSWFLFIYFVVLQKQSSFSVIRHFLPIPARILPALTFNGCDPLCVNADRILPGFGRKWRIRKTQMFLTDSNSLMYLDRNLRLVLYDVETNTMQVLLTTEQVVKLVSKIKKNHWTFEWNYPFFGHGFQIGLSLWKLQRYWFPVNTLYFIWTCCLQSSLNMNQAFLSTSQRFILILYDQITVSMQSQRPKQLDLSVQNSECQLSWHDLICPWEY